AAPGDADRGPGVRPGIGLVALPAGLDARNDPPAVHHGCASARRPSCAHRLASRAAERARTADCHRHGGRGAARLGRGRHRKRVRVARARQPVHRSAGSPGLHDPDGAADAVVGGRRALQRRRRPAARRARPARDGMMRLPAVVLATLIVAALAAPSLAPYAPDRIDLSIRRAAPSAAHVFGTDELGRDVLARVLYGARVSLAVGLLSALIAGASGVVIGGVAGYAGGAVDAVLMRITDGILAVPRLPLLMIVAVVLRPSVPMLIVLIGLAGWMETARVVR